ncbi:MAG: tetratricopeptide repeat protein, partial [Phycisphaeraceae bacterium]
MNLRAPLACLLIASLLLALPAPAFAEADRQFTFAARLMQQGENDLAQEAFEEFLSRFPDDRRISDVRYYMALLARKAGNHEQAERHLTHVDELRHVSPASLNLLRGQLALEAGEAEQAIEHLEAIKPDSLDDTETRATWHYLLATAYRSADNLDAAADHFDRASDAASSVRATAILELGKTRMQLNQPMAALEALRSALDESIPTAEAAEARYLVASLAYDQRHFDMAIEYYQQVTRQHQRSDYYRPAVIGLLRAMGAAEQNQDLLDRYENSRNQLAAGDQAEALYLAAAAHVRLAEYDQAIARLRDFQRRYDADHAFAGRVSYLRAVCLYQTDLAAFEAWLAELDAAESEVAQR